MMTLKSSNYDFNMRMLLRATILAVVGASLVSTVCVDLAWGQIKGIICPSQNSCFLRPRAMEERGSDKDSRNLEAAKRKARLLRLMKAQGINSMLELSRRSGIDRAVMKDIINGVGGSYEDAMIRRLAGVLEIKPITLRLWFGVRKSEPTNISPYIANDKGPSPDKIFAVGRDREILLALIELLETQPDVYFDQRLPAQRLYAAMRSEGNIPDECTDIELGARLQRTLGSAILFKIFSAPSGDTYYVQINKVPFIEILAKKLHLGAIPEGATPQIQNRIEKQLQHAI